MFSTGLNSAQITLEFFHNINKMARIMINNPDVPLLANITPSPWPVSVGKRLFDVAAASAMISICAIPCLIIAGLIKCTSSGPVIFEQERLGLKGKPFSILKFRTMKQELCDPQGRQPAQKYDARVTKIGRVLRKTGLDEMPQVLNILIGDMSIVGVRPYTRHDMDHRCDTGHQALRATAKPGLLFYPEMVSIWKLNDLNTASAKAKQIETDYFINSSLTTDLRVIADIALNGFAHLKHHY